MSQPALVKYYEQLSPILKEQLSKLISEYENDSRVKKEVAKLLPKHVVRDYHRDERKKIIKTAYKCALLKAVSPLELLRKSNFPILRCYDDEKKEIIEFKSIITKGDHVRVIHGVSRPSNTEVVVKFYKSKHHDINHEIDIYSKLKNMGANSNSLPYFSTQYKFWDQPILVIEKLEEITGKDDEFEIGRQIIPQLKLLHASSAIHCDLKPGNIMRRGNQYLLIDYGGCASKRLNHGYMRFIYTQRYCSQRPHVKNQVVTAKQDLLELGYTMKGVQNIRKGIREGARFGENKYDPIRTGFKGTLALYIDRVHRIDERNIFDQDYDDLLQILFSSTPNK